MLTRMKLGASRTEFQLKHWLAALLTVILTLGMDYKCAGGVVLGKLVCMMTSRTVSFSYQSDTKEGSLKPERCSSPEY